MSGEVHVNRSRWALITGLLSVLSFVISLVLMPPGRGDNKLSDILLLACVPLCLVAGAIGSKHWWWLILVFVIVFFFFVLTHLQIGF